MLETFYIACPEQQEEIKVPETHDTLMKKLKKMGFSFSKVAAGGPAPPFAHVESVAYAKADAHFEESARKHMTERLHEAEHGELLLAGEAFLDVRDEKDEWIRVELRAGDWVTIPAGAFYRIVPTHTKHVQMQSYLHAPETADNYRHNLHTSELASRKRFEERLKSL